MPPVACLGFESCVAFRPGSFNLLQGLGHNVRCRVKRASARDQNRPWPASEIRKKADLRLMCNVGHGGLSCDRDGDDRFAEVLVLSEFLRQYDLIAQHEQLRLGYMAACFYGSQVFPSKRF